MYIEWNCRPQRFCAPKIRLKFLASLRKILFSIEENASEVGVWVGPGDRAAPHFTPPPHARPIMGREGKKDNQGDMDKVSGRGGSSHTPTSQWGRGTTIEKASRRRGRRRERRMCDRGQLFGVRCVGSAQEIALALTSPSAASGVQQGQTWKKPWGGGGYWNPLTARNKAYNTAKGKGRGRPEGPLRSHGQGKGRRGSSGYGNAMHAVRTQCKVLDVGKYSHPSYLLVVKHLSCALRFL